MFTREEKVSFVILLAVLSLLSYVPPNGIPGAQASPAAFTLWGSAFDGWGFNQAAITSPGPDLTVLPGESVAMSLFAADGPFISHNWGVDYNGNGFSDAGEPLAPPFNSKTTAQQYGFVATTQEGEFTYFCFFHPVSMFGKFIVRANHDVAVTGLSTSRSFAYSGVSSQPIRVDVTLANQGQASETFTVTARVGTTVIGTQTVTLAAGATGMVSFNWDAYLLARGSYTLSAQASSVPGETNLLNNTLGGVAFTVRLPGDVNNDCTVNVSDLARVGASFLKTTGQPDRKSVV